MKTKLIGLTIILLIFTACRNSESKNDSRSYYNAINLYFSPAEDYLLRHEFFTNFINYPNDLAKLGLKGKVYDIKYTTVHELGYLFNEEGKIMGKIFTENGGNMKRASIYTHHYDDEGRLVKISEEDRVNTGGGYRTVSNRTDKVMESIISYTASGKPLKRAVNDLNSNRVDHTVSYEYDENGICRGVAIATDSPNRRADAVVFSFECNEKGLMTFIHAKRSRIPYRLASGERKITPAYDYQGRLVAMRETAIPTNNEAYRINEIFSTTQYKYNPEGDIVECAYSDTAYPSGAKADFVLTFVYDYDRQGNWVRKRIRGDIYVLEGLMNSYYYGQYPILRVESGNGNELGEVVIERTINYYGED